MDPVNDPQNILKRYEDGERVAAEHAQREADALAEVLKNTRNGVGSEVMAPAASRPFVYGLDIKYVVAVQSDGTFVWDDSYLYGDGDPAPPSAAVLEPPPFTAQPLPGFTFPLAPTYRRNSEVDKRFASGYYFCANTDVAAKDGLRDRLLRTSNPPGVVPSAYIDGKYIMKPIEGMINMPPGYPFVTLIDGDKSRLLTIGCFHTLDSLRMHGDGAEISRLSNELWDWSFGTSDRKPLYTISGLKPNYRSKAVQDGSGDGSYSIATTLGEGQGKGVVQPAVQANTEEAKVMLEAALRCVHGLYRKIAPLSMSKEEWDVIEFRDKDLNVFALGGIDPGPTSCQMNVSSAWFGGSLVTFLGILQGQWHVDKKDDIVRWTLLIVQIRIPEGSDPGAFMQARSGLYVWTEVGPDGQVRWFLLFKGNDLHSGTAPTVDPASKAAFLAELQSMYLHVGEENRVVFVAYPSTGACSRHVKAVAVTDVLGFGNDGGDPSKDNKEYAHTFATDGRPALGSKSDWANRIGREVYMLQYNFHRSVGFAVNRTLPCYTADDGKLVAIDPMPFDPETDAERVSRMRGLYSFMEQTSRMYAIQMTKEDFKTAQLKAVAAILKAKDGGAPDNTAGLGESDGALAVVLPAVEKRKRADDSDESSVESEEDEDGAPVVSAICGHDFDDDGRKRYSVNYHERGDEAYWVHAKVIKARELVSDYEKRLLSRVVSEDSSRSTMSSNATYTHLDDLLDIDRLSAESRSIKHALSTLGVNVPTPTTSASRRMFATFDGANVLYDSYRENAFDNGVAFRFVTQLHTASSTIAETDATAFKLDILRACNQIGACRGLLYVYQWYTMFGPALAKSIFAEHNSGGDEAVVGAYPQFAPLANKLMEWITYGFVSDSVEDSSTAFPATRMIDAGTPPLRLPSDLYGLNPNPRSASPVVFALPSMPRLRTYDKRYSLARLCFLEILSSEVIVNGIRGADQKFNTPNRSETVELIKARSIVRGAILDCLICRLDDDCVFASIAIDRIMRTPTMLFGDASLKDLPLSKRILADPDFITQPLADHLETYNRERLRDVMASLHANTAAALARFAVDIPPKARGIRKRRPVVTVGSMPVDPALLLGDVFPDPDTPAMAMLALMLRETLAAARKQPMVNENLRRILNAKNAYTSSRSLQYDDPDHYNPNRADNQFHRLLLEGVGANKVTSKFGLSNLLVRLGTGQGSKTIPFQREYLNKHWFTSAGPCIALFRQAHAADVNIHNANVWGQHAVDLAVRKDVNGALLFEEKFNPMFEPSVLGLWMQFLRCELVVPAPKTSKDSAAAKPPKKKTKTTAAPSVAKDSASFDDAAYAAGSLPARKSSGKKKAKKSSPLSAPTASSPVGATTEDAAAPAIVYTWDNELLVTGLVDRDPSGYEGSKPTYAQALYLATVIKIAGFGSGITNMQLANSLALMGVCGLPDLEDMGNIIFKHPTKGGAEGLRTLGFSLQVSEEKKKSTDRCRFITALRCVYDFLDDHMSADDKKVLGFGAMFVEHILCKTTRWNRALSMDGGLVGLARRTMAFTGDLDGRERFPIPLMVDRVRLAGLVADDKKRT